MSLIASFCRQTKIGLPQGRGRNLLMKGRSMTTVCQHTFYLDCEPDKLFRWALETAGVSAPPRTITATTWQLLRERKGENGFTPEFCLTLLLFQFPSMFQVKRNGGLEFKATNVSYRLQKANGDWSNHLTVGRTRIRTRPSPTQTSP